MTPVSGDILSPLPGNGGLITVSDILQSSAVLHWIAATDVITPSASLQYKAYISTSNNIDTYADAENNGTQLVDWQSGIIAYSLTGLSAATSYFCNVFVRDAAGNIAAYETITVTTLTATIDEVFLFSIGAFTGNMVDATSDSVRNDLDQLCQNSAQFADLSCTTTRAFISISNTDSISNMAENFGIPTDLQIFGPTGTLIATDWNNLFAADLLASFETAGISSSFWWSGSDENGYAVSDNCNNWMIGDNSVQGMSGAHNRTNLEWLEDSSRNCNNSLYLICICW